MQKLAALVGACQGEVTILTSSQWHLIELQSPGPPLLMVDTKYSILSPHGGVIIKSLFSKEECHITQPSLGKYRFLHRNMNEEQRMAKGWGKI